MAASKKDGKKKRKKASVRDLPAAKSVKGGAGSSPIRPATRPDSARGFFGNTDPTHSYG
jgi:hypothetical protein